MERDLKRHPATSYLYGDDMGADWEERVHAEAIRVAERQLVYARRLGRTYSSYATWAARLERELVALKTLVKNREGS